MAITIVPGAEPIPGYKLLHFLGRGGFGEVWKAQAPGGFLKAIKFLRGDLASQAADAPQPASQELGALKRIQAIHHPFILSVERYDIVEGQLVIVMELADRTLKNRYDEWRSQGHPGIPRDELLRYLEETADALDFMNIEHGLQHLDVKPKNLFLVGHHVKVADFGVVLDLAAYAAAPTRGITPRYAAPEVLLGGLSRYCDQYSLALIYQELLTGALPFEFKDLKQCREQRLDGKPNVAPLAEAERPVILRALSRRPNERFHSCLELVKALRECRPAPAPSAEFIRLRCPHCGKKGKVRLAFQGRQVKCSRCKRSFNAPGPAPLTVPEDVTLAPIPEEVMDVEAEILVDFCCPRCGHAGTVPEENLGRPMKCPGCGSSFTVEQPSSPSKTLPGKQEPEQGRSKRTK